MYLLCYFIIKMTHGYNKKKDIERVKEKEGRRKEERGKERKIQERTES